MTLDDTADDWQPTRTSTALVVVVSLTIVAALARAGDVVWPAVVGSVGGVTLAALVWASGWHRYRAAGSVVASVLVLPVGASIVATTLGTVLVLSGSLFPAPTAAKVPETVIQMSARAAVVAGTAATVFGVTAATRGVLDTPTLERAATTSLRTTVLPFLLATVLTVSAALKHLEANATGPGLDAVVGDVVSTFNGILFQPDPLGPHLPTFVLMVGVALLASHRGLRALPLTELLDESSGEGTLRADVERAQVYLLWGAILALALLPVAGIVQLIAPPQQLRMALGPGVYGLLAGVTTAPELRSLAWWTTLVGLGITGIVWLLRRFVQSSADRIGSVIGPFVGGAIVVGLTVLVADDVLTAAVDWVAAKLPGEFATMFTTTADSVVEVYGSATIVLTAVAFALVLATGVISILWLTLATDYVEERTAGLTIASLALFNTAAFAGVVDVSNALVLGALVAAVVVWDAGEFGVTLGEEIGRRADTRRAELVHATGTLAVGGVGAGLALTVADVSLGTASIETGQVALGLLAVLGGLLFLVVALR